MIEPSAYELANLPDCSREYISDLEEENERLQAIIDKLPNKEDMCIFLPKASEKTMRNGWKLDWKFLDTIHRQTDVAMEEIESVLLVAQEVCNAQAVEAARSE
jgi:hypothetical protein